MANFDTLGVCILQAPGERLWHVEVSRELISLGSLVNDF
jgi:hypothetical protein